MTVFLLALLAGFIFRLHFQTLHSNDEWVAFAHLERQSQGRWLNYTVPNSIFPGRDGYPILHHFMISRLPRRMWGWFGRLSTALYDVLSAVLVWLMAANLAPNLAIKGKLAGLDFPTAVAILFYFSPILFPTTGRLRTINARTAGLPVTIIFFWIAYAFVALNATYLLIILTLIVLLAIALSMFAIQAIFFFTPVIAFWFDAPALLVPLVAAILIGYSLPIGIRPALLHSWHFKIWYIRNIQRGTSAALRNRLTDISALPRQLRTNFPAFITTMVTRNTLTIALLNIPEAIYLLVILISGSLTLTEPDTVAVQYCASILSAAFLIFCLTSLPWLSFLGQAERYFEYGLPFISILYAAQVWHLPEASGVHLFWLVFIFHLAVAHLNLLQPNLQELRQVDFGITPDLSEATRWITENSPDARLLCVPVKLSYVLAFMQYRGMVSPGLKFYYRYLLRPGDTGYRYFENDLKSPFGDDREAIVQRDPRELSKEYRITHLLIEKRWLKFMNSNSPYVKFAGDTASIMFENETFLVIDSRGKEEHSTK